MPPITDSLRRPSGDAPIAGLDAGQAPRTELEQLFTVAERLRASPEIVRDRLRFLTRDDDAAAELAQDSYRHQNGFLKIRLLTEPDYTVRLHMWPASRYRRGEHNPHGHRWQFASWVMTGDGLVERTYRRCDGSAIGARAYHHYDYRGSGTTRDFVLQGRTWLHEEDVFSRPSGDVYVCPSGVVHTIEPSGNGLVATVVVQGPVISDSTPVYARFADDPRSREQRLSGPELARHLAVINALHPASG